MRTEGLHMNRILLERDDIYKKETELSSSERDMHMFELVNALVTCVDENVGCEDNPFEIYFIPRERSEKQRSLIFSKEKNAYSIGLEHDFYMEYLVFQERLEFQTASVCVCKEKNSNLQKITHSYTSNPEIVFNRTLEIFSMLCKYTDSLHC